MTDENNLPVAFDTVTILLKCGMCDYVCPASGATLSGWCSACGNAMCVKHDPKEGRGRCRDCIALERPTRMEEAGRAMAQDLEQRILNSIGAK